MITVDCSRALAVKEQLLVHVADRLEALPILKSDKFILAPIDDHQEIDKESVLSVIREFLESLSLNESFHIIPKGDKIVIEPLPDKGMKEKLERIAEKKKELFFECTHCGFMTRYETEWKAHKVVHYL